jgi:hypothetical protein
MHASKEKNYQRSAQASSEQLQLRRWHCNENLRRSSSSSSSMRKQKQQEQQQSTTKHIPDERTRGGDGGGDCDGDGTDEDLSCTRWWEGGARGRGATPGKAFLLSAFAVLLIPIFLVRDGVHLLVPRRCKESQKMCQAGAKRGAARGGLCLRVLAT